MPPLPLNDAHWGGFFHYTSAGVRLPDKKTLPRLEGFSFELKQLNKLTKKNNYNGTKIYVLLLTERKSK